MVSCLCPWKEERRRDKPFPSRGEGLWTSGSPDGVGKEELTS